MYSYNPYYEKYLMHYGVKHKSGRYPWGSGERPYQGDGGKLTIAGEKALKSINKWQIRKERRDDRIRKALKMEGSSTNALTRFGNKIQTAATKLYIADILGSIANPILNKKIKDFQNKVEGGLVKEEVERARREYDSQGGARIEEYKGTQYKYDKNASKIEVQSSKINPANLAVSSIIGTAVLAIPVANVYGMALVTNKATKYFKNTENLKKLQKMQIKFD